MKEDELLEAGKKKADMLEVERRIYQVSLMLRRKSVSFIIQYCAENFKVGARQTRKYIREARKEWKKYFEKLKGDGISYHVAQLRDLKDQAYSKKVAIGKGDDKQVITVSDLGLVFEITKEEAKLMGLHIERKEVGPPGSFAEWVKAVKEEKERRRKNNSSPNR